MAAPATLVSPALAQAGIPAVSAYAPVGAATPFAAPVTAAAAAPLTAAPLAAGIINPATISLPQYGQPITAVNMHPGTMVFTPNTVVGVPNATHSAAAAGPVPALDGAFNPAVANGYPIITPQGVAPTIGAWGGAQGYLNTIPNAPFPISGTWPTVPINPEVSFYGDSAPSIANYAPTVGAATGARYAAPLATTRARTSRAVAPYPSAGPSTLGAVPFNPAHGNYTRYPLGDVKKRVVQYY